MTSLVGRLAVDPGDHLTSLYNSFVRTEELLGAGLDWLRLRKLCGLTLPVFISPSSAEPADEAVGGIAAEGHGGLDAPARDPKMSIDDVFEGIIALDRGERDAPPCNPEPTDVVLECLAA